jgi:hypothetical protein
MGADPMNYKFRVLGLVLSLVGLVMAITQFGTCFVGKKSKPVRAGYCFLPLENYLTIELDGSKSLVPISLSYGRGRTWMAVVAKELVELRRRYSAELFINDSSSYLHTDILGLSITVRAYQTVLNADGTEWVPTQ